MMRKLIDLSHDFTDAMPVYPGDPDVTLTPCATIGRDGFSDHVVNTGLHVGTHMDAPAHMIDGGAILTDFPLSRFQGYGVLVDGRGKDIIDVDSLSGLEIKPGNVVLVWTGWSDRYRTDAYYQDWPVLTESFSNALADRGVSIVGLDTPSPDENGSSVVHKRLFSQDILIVENLTNLEDLKGYKLFRVHAYPIKYTADAAPVRVIAEVG